MGDACKVELSILIDMRKSWSNASVSYLQTTGGAELNNGVLWPAQDNTTVYAFGGHKTYIWNAWLAPPTSMYRFALSGSNGSWEEWKSSGTVWSSLTRPDYGAGAMLGNTGYVLGGIEDNHSAQDRMDVGGSIPLPGIVSYNIDNSQWSNDSAPANISNIFFESVSNFGPSGLLIGAGHADYPNDGITTISHLTIYEPTAKTWHNQSTTGDAPKIRDGACTVGVPGDNNTYEM